MAAFIAWVLAHQALLLGGLGVALLDLLFALVPAWESNGILHWIYLFFVSKKAV